MIAKVLISIVAFLQAYFMVLEMFFRTKPLGRRAFGLTQEFADSTKALAMNQGLYNGFIAAGFVWALVHPDALVARQIAYFFCACMFVAGIFGGATASWKIIPVQALPALLAFIAVYFSK